MHLTLNGSLILYKRYGGGNGQSLFLGLTINSMGLVSLAGRTSATSPLMAVSYSTSLFFTKNDLSFEDNNCFKNTN